jgi:hypothetical protein
MSHRQTRTHKTHHGPNLGESTTFPLIIYYMLGHKTKTQMSFCLETLKCESWNSQSWESRDFRGPQLCVHASNWDEVYSKVIALIESLPTVCHTLTSTQEIWGDSQLLMVESQIDNLFLGPSFGHDLCLKCLNGSYEPISDICVPRSFQWYKELFNPMGFGPWNIFLKI